MKLSYQKILYEIMYLSFILVCGIYTGYFAGRYGLSYINKIVILIDLFILDIPGGVEFVE